MTPPAQFQWTSASLTHAGKVRRVNEDACLELPWKGIWAVADGMGGHSAGDVASQMVVQALSEVSSNADPGVTLDEVEDRLAAVNAELFGMTDEDGNPKTIGCTVIDLLLEKNLLATARQEFVERTGGGVNGSRWQAPLCDYAAPVNFRWPEYVSTERGHEWWIPG